MSRTETEQKVTGTQSAEMQYKTLSMKKHMTVRIPRGLTEAIEDFLKTEQASKMGFHSKANVVATAVRNFLSQYGVYDQYKD